MYTLALNLFFFLMGTFTRNDCGEISTLNYSSAACIVFRVVEEGTAENVTWFSLRTPIKVIGSWISAVVILIHLWRRLPLC